MTTLAQHIYQHLVCIFITTPALEIEVVLFAHSCGGRYTNENEDISTKGGIHVPKWMFFMEIFQPSLYTPPKPGTPIGSASFWKYVAIFCQNI